MRARSECAEIGTFPALFARAWKLNHDVPVDQFRKRSSILSTPRALAICIKANTEGMTLPRSARDR